MTKIIKSIAAFYFILIIFGCSEDSSNGSSGITGAYLGQELPGNSPVVFAPGIICTEGMESNLLVYPGGEEIYFNVFERAGNEATANIYVTKLIEGTWTNPEPLNLNNEFSDGYIALHPDGSRMYFQSNRNIDPAESQYEWNIWYCDRAGNDWSQPHSMGRPINGMNHTSGPSVTSEGTMYFTIMTIGGLSEIYRSELVDGEYQEPVRLPDEINSITMQFDSYIAPDESYLIFNAYEHPVSYGSTDLYISFRSQSGEWSSAINMGPEINTNNVEGSATISYDGNYIFFARYQLNDRHNLDIFWMDSEFVNSL